LLAEIYLKGEVVTRDSKKGLQLFQLAARQGNATAALTLANHYFVGQDVQSNYVDAYKWMVIAKQLGACPT